MAAVHPRSPREDEFKNSSKGIHSTLNNEQNQQRLVNILK
jgi:hypothetical protein